MKQKLSFWFLCVSTAITFIPVSSFAQKETFEFVSYTPPKNWKKEVKANTYTSYTITDKQKNDYCQIFIMLSTAGKGNIKKDFEMEWQNLIAKQYNLTEAPQITEPQTKYAKTVGDGWQMKGGIASFVFNNAKSIAMLTTMSGYNKVVSIVTLTNNEAYIPAIQQLLGSIEMTTPTPADSKINALVVPGNGKFAFTSTNFDDGWISTVQEDWVQVTKGNIKVLIHYPNKNADAYNSVLLDGLKNAWNILIAPKYNSATNMEFKSSGSWESIEFAEADMVEKISGKTVHVVFFKKNFSNGAGKYIEFITPDKKIFQREFGTFENASANFGTGSGWDKMVNMVNYNKFAIAASDLRGKWTSNFTGMTQYVNAYTGANAGADTHASNENFEFGAGNTYKWDIGVASGFVGNIKFQSVKSAGKFAVVNNWQVSFTDIEGKPRTYNVQFTCIKGARILWFGDTGFGKQE